jgi:hypothetical protein
MKPCRNCGQPVPPKDARSYQPWADWVTHLSPACCAVAVIRARTNHTNTSETR